MWLLLSVQFVEILWVILNYLGIERASTDAVVNTASDICLEHVLARLTGYRPPLAPGSRWIAPLCGTAIFLYGGRVFQQGAARAISARLPGILV